MSTDTTRPNRVRIRLRQPWRWMPFSVRIAWARWRSRLARHRVARRVLTLILGLLVATVALSYRSDAHRAREQWGPYDEIVVVGRDVTIGSATGDASLRFDERPRSVVPPDALRSMPDQTDRIVSMLTVGEALTARDLASSRPESIEPPHGLRAVAVPADTALPPLSAGDLVDVVLLDVHRSQTAAHELLDAAAVVLLVSDETVTIAVPTRHVGPITQTVEAGRVALALR